MEAVGQLTGGVAHDFNNLLTLILGGLEVIGRQMPNLPDPAALRESSEPRTWRCRACGGRTALTSRLLAFSRQQALTPQSLDANKLVAGVCEMLRRTLGEAIALETVLAGGLWRAFADPNQLENALLNLALNARDAMPDGGKLTIETANASLDRAYVASLDGTRRARPICDDRGRGHRRRHGRRRRASGPSIPSSRPRKSARALASA